MKKSYRKLHSRRCMHGGKTLHLSNLFIAASYYMLSEKFRKQIIILFPTIIPLRCACCAEQSRPLECFLHAFIACRVTQRAFRRCKEKHSRKCKNTMGKKIQTKCKLLCATSLYTYTVEKSIFVELLQLVY